ncbi:hypothetical protein VB773_05235 [Haloarculaceae archaeon H-GB2-1]|nr:hypothetical protein [Haloarculaceae archaeon H-GB1-1]MEA5388981.1 hypothetical protein [Haloarculaceae archaeon H-GB11]MEA5407039.1 hypothetical protein [Haloarculaceae archaeon H-GB2-1]
MQRRDVLKASGLAAAGSLAGCNGLFETQSLRTVPLVEDRPDAVYVPSHVEGMEMIGMGTKGRRAVGLMYSYPHRFWTVTGTRTEKVSLREEDSVHLMATVWDVETKTVLPVDAGVTVDVRRDGESVAKRSPWPMLSQNMGFHFGDNFALDGDGTYSVVVDVGATSLARRGSFAGEFADPLSVEIPFEYEQATRDEITFEKLPDRKGSRDALSPMQMDMVPLSTAPSAGDLDAMTTATTESGDATFLVAVVEDDDGPYLAVSPRTPYNRYVMPLMSLSATLTRDGETVFDDALPAAIGPSLDYHYGTTIPSYEGGEELTITVDAPPQVSRHEGYETAFLDVPAATVTL